MDRSVFFVLFSAIVFLGCNEPPVPAPLLGEAHESAAPPDEPEERALDAAGPVLEEARFELRLEADDTYAVGEEAAFHVSLRPRADFEMEARYPYRVAVDAGDGIELPRAELARRDAARLDAEEARFDVHFTPREAGAHRCVVDVEFAVCAENGCFPMERRLAVELPAS